MVVHWVEEGDPMRLPVANCTVLATDKDTSRMEDVTCHRCMDAVELRRQTLRELSFGSNRPRVWDVRV